MIKKKDMCPWCNNTGYIHYVCDQGHYGHSVKCTFPGCSYSSTKNKPIKTPEGV
jgi:hypothetical protein